MDRTRDVMAGKFVVESIVLEHLLGMNRIGFHFFIYKNSADYQKLRKHFELVHNRPSTSVSRVLSHETADRRPLHSIVGSLHNKRY